MVSTIVPRFSQTHWRLYVPQAANDCGGIGMIMGMPTLDDRQCNYNLLDDQVLTLKNEGAQSSHSYGIVPKAPRES